jgi:hypothetical protein
MFDFLRALRREQLQTSVEPFSRVVERLAMLNPQAAEFQPTSIDTGTSETGATFDSTVNIGGPVPTPSEGTVQIASVPGVEVVSWMNAKQRVVDAVLWSDVQRMAKDLGFGIRVISGWRPPGKMGQRGLHVHNKALDIQPAGPRQGSALFKSQGDQMATWLQHRSGRGYVLNKTSYTGSSYYSILWWVADHYDHLHIGAPGK